MVLDLGGVGDAFTRPAGTWPTAFRGTLLDLCLFGCYRLTDKSSLDIARRSGACGTVPERLRVLQGDRLGAALHHELPVALPVYNGPRLFATQAR
jgi:hypothetical protein